MVLTDVTNYQYIYKPATPPPKWELLEYAGLEAVLEGGPWLIRKSLIILKKWSMDTRLLKEEFDIVFDMGLYCMMSYSRVLQRMEYRLIATFKWMILPKKPSVLMYDWRPPDVIQVDEGFPNGG
ncbi:hypothetical protein Tco_0093272 [Tanacetum coccineum]